MPKTDDFTPGVAGGLLFIRKIMKFP